MSEISDSNRLKFVLRHGIPMRNVVSYGVYEYRYHGIFPIIWSKSEIDAIDVAIRQSNGVTHDKTN